MSIHVIWLVVSTHLKNMSQIGNLPQIRGENKKSLKPPSNPSNQPPNLQQNEVNTDQRHPSLVLVQSRADTLQDTGQQTARDIASHITILSPIHGGTLLVINKWSCKKKLYRWPNTWVTVVIPPISEVIILL